jgi:hypothetical protein
MSRTNSIDAEVIPHSTRQCLAGTNPRQQQIAGNFEQHVADKEDARSDAIGRVGERELALHLELREADVDAVEVREHVAERQERQ